LPNTVSNINKVPIGPFWNKSTKVALVYNQSASNLLTCPQQVASARSKNVTNVGAF